MTITVERKVPLRKRSAHAQWKEKKRTTCGRLPRATHIIVLRILADRSPLLSSLEEAKTTNERDFENKNFCV